jgi:DNA-binding MurR/RpiR family transcriptional regulator
MPATAAHDTGVRIRSLLPSLAPAERRVAERVLADPGAVAASTITALAHDCGTSETTVIRFCRAVGFTGYPALRLALAAEIGRHRRRRRPRVGGRQDRLRRRPRGRGDG